MARRLPRIVGRSRRRFTPASSVRATLLPILLAACMPLPPGAPERALYGDLRRIVETRERTDWVVDRIELEEVAPTTMQSACRTTPEMRANLRRWLDRRILAEGGPAEAAFRRSGGDLDEVEDIVTLERVRLVLDHADQHAQADCPFWLQPDPSFAGVQSDAGRFVLYLETMGGGELSWSEGRGTLGGAGVGRLLPAVGLGQRATLLFGAEVGGGGALARDGSGGIRASFAAGVPLLLRLQSATRFWDVEVAGTARVPRGDLDALRPGLRASVASGISALRISSLMPYFGLWIGYEYLPAADGEPAVQVARIGSRFGVDWDP